MTDTQSTIDRAKALAQDYIQKGDLNGFFKKIYEIAEGKTEVIPWAQMTTNPLVKSWIELHKLQGQGERALVIGCGLGDDAEELSQLNFEVTAFDISDSAIEWCRQRFPESRVKYEPADLLNLPNDYFGQFEFVLECYTIQSLPIERRNETIAAVARCVAPGGKLLVVCDGCEPSDERPRIPWPVTRLELERLKIHGLQEIGFEELNIGEPSQKKFRTWYTKKW